MKKISLHGTLGIKTMYILKCLFDVKLFLLYPVYELTSFHSVIKLALTQSNTCHIWSEIFCGHTCTFPLFMNIQVCSYTNYFG